MRARLNRSIWTPSVKHFAGLSLIATLAMGVCAPFQSSASELPQWAAVASIAELAVAQDAESEPTVADYRAEAVEQEIEFRPLEAVKFEPLETGEAQGELDERASDLFGEAPIQVSHLAVERRWRAIAPFHAAALFGPRCDADRELCDSALMHAWSRLRGGLRGSPSQLDKIRRVNAEVNAAVRYRTDSENYGTPDYWASPDEMARRGSGDCKETALAKMWILSALDVPLSRMRIVVLKDLQRGLGHAVLVVSLNGENLVLDNVTSEIRRDVAIAWYQPLYAVSTGGSWIYGVRRPKLIANTASPARS
jgi:predicted transglutaminase-like cysteine proteinase